MPSIVPFPCLLILTLVDAAPLDPPGAGSSTNYMFWIRNCVLSGQRYYTMLLPIIKILAKTLISSTLGSKFELLPQIMIFNVDVFNALYVSSSMQSSNSITTTLAMVALDVAQALVSISDIKNFMKSIV
ncbi:unnamed protein product [Phytophthora lilii]|uniref:Unnamed protein product n=1 Tax=Phytophthora lilii TaxID=2077276 RepID=A0A9W6UE08_9STRA|nr:unnamed protein product [Phytophthora lilii]